ncbi:MAG: rhodanese-like domain-containing protein [Planctomycetaceae bacterium]
MRRVPRQDLIQAVFVLRLVRVVTLAARLHSAYLNETCSMRLLLLIVCSLCVCAATQADEFARWEFETPESGWSANDQAALSVSDGHLTIDATGNDPFLTASVAKSAAGWHALTITAKYRGRTSAQVFWTTEKDGETSEARSVKSEIRGNGNQFREYQIWFKTDGSVTSIRLDPMSRPGQMQLASIVLTDDAPPEPKATPVESIKTLQDFKVELLYAVRSEQFGSWVSMASDPKGRLIVSDQYGKLYRVTPPPIGSDSETQVELIDVELGMAQGLLYAFDALYVMVNGNDEFKSGLYRVTDSDNDDHFDTVEVLRHLDGASEHGPHAIVLAPDGKSLYVCAGNHTNIPEFDRSRVPRNWDEDQLLPRMWDAGGHAVGRMAPGGWIANVSRDGKQWELHASGFRNEYDIAFNSDGELFTYDADMEWDVGSPWYRPTRVNHATSGAEFGWRSGTGKWPTWYPDSLPSVVDIGPGSPTGIAFGTGAKFPAKYQKSLFIADWSYGMIYAVHLTPTGSTFSGEAERFVSAAPLPVTDMVINPVDRAMYFTIGGRRTQSALYRVTYTGSESTAAVTDGTAEGAELRDVRHRLEALHRDDAENAVDEAWRYLGHSDRNIRFAARIAIEHRPVSEWEDRALAENSSVDAKITALLALARNGKPQLADAVITSMATLGGDTLTEEQSLAALRVLELTFIRMGRPSGDLATQIAAHLSQRFPSGSSRINRELCALLVYLGDSSVAAKAVPLMEDAPTQEEQMHYALCLRTLKNGWTPALRERYFRWFVTSANMRGGHSFSGFLKNIRSEAIETLSESEKESLKDVLALTPEPAEPSIDAASRPFVRDWTISDLLADVEAGLSGRSFDNGRKMFEATGCFKCHRFAAEGGIVGPDLTGVGRRFDARTLLESLVDPSKVISDQYEATVFVLEDGRQVVGRVVNLNGDMLMVSENMLDPGRLTNVRREEIDEMFTSKTSMMPKGLLNNLSREEILDLVAYLQSGGDASAAVFAAAARPVVPVATFTESGHTTDTVQDVMKRVVAKQALLLDVREPDEWNAGHLRLAQLLPLSVIRTGEFSAEQQKLLPKDMPIYVHCRSGGRVLVASKLLREKGYDIRPLKSGYEALRAADFEKAE